MMGAVVVDPGDGPPTRRRRNAVLGLFDRPLVTDWLAWWTAFWAIFGGLAVGLSPRPDQDALPHWLNGLLATFVLGALFGLLPAMIRLFVRSARASRR
jgi:hypothetical protein